MISHAESRLSKLLAIYYILLLAIMVSWVNPVNSPPFLARMLFLGAIVFPAWHFTRSLVPILFAFHSIATYSFAATYMPRDIYVYGIVLIILFVMEPKRLPATHNRIKFPSKLFLWFAIYMVMVDVVFDSYLNPFTYLCFVVLCLCFYTIHRDDSDPTTAFSLMFVIASIILSVYYYFGRTLYTESVGGSESGMEGMAWTDSNYFAMIVGMGMVAAIVELSRRQTLNLFIRILYVVSICCSLFVLGTAGSRGAILSMTGMLSIYMLFSKVKLRYKLIGSIFGLAILYYLYVGNYFELLLYKITNDETLTSGRTDIWYTKLNLFFRESNVLGLLFGIGYKNGKELGRLELGDSFMFHNDYVACLVKYGFVGLLFFLVIICKPLRLINRKDRDRPLLLSCIVYLMLCCVSLEPFTGGYFQYYVFYMYIYLLAYKSKNKIA